MKADRHGTFHIGDQEFSWETWEYKGTVNIETVIDGETGSDEPITFRAEMSWEDLGNLIDNLKEAKDSLAFHIDKIQQSGTIVAWKLNETESAV